MHSEQATAEQVAFVFPGQGSQFVGMGQHLASISAAARHVFEQADEALGFRISQLCFEGPAEVLQDTVNAQPAILTASHAALEALRERWHQVGGTIRPIAVAGHSLGEFTALVAAGALKFEDALHLVRERGELMRDAGKRHPGGMAAVIGMDAGDLAPLCAQAARECGSIVVVANDNGPGQTVISGEITGLTRAMELAREHGARKVVRLDISIASHSPLMNEAAEALQAHTSSITFSQPDVPIIANLTGRFITSIDDIRKNVGQHMVRPVQWTNSVGEMVDAGVDTFLEVGPGQVLSGLVRRIRREVKTLSLADLGIPMTGTPVASEDAARA